jgi:DNA topoisomerase IB
MIKRRVQPEDVIINCSKDSDWPKAPAGHKWKEVRHDNTVSKFWFGKLKNDIGFNCRRFTTFEYRTIKVVNDLVNSHDEVHFKGFRKKFLPDIM